MDRICMYMPSARGGHPLYGQELLTALTHHPRGGDRFELVTSEDLEEQFRAGVYRVHAILPRLRHRSDFRTQLSWAASRFMHYFRRDRFFINWLRNRPDITGVHFQELTPLLAAPLFRGTRRLGKKVFYTVHSIRPHAYPPVAPPWVWDHCHRQACRVCDCLFVLTENLREELSEFLGDGHPPIEIVPHGTWTIHHPVPVPPIGERLKWKRLLFFGTIRRNKGLDLLLRAAPLLPEYSFTIAGEPLERDYFQNEVLPQVTRLKAEGLSINLIDRFLSDEEAGELFATHSAILLPYTRQFTAQSGVLFLALAHELPVVASEVGGLRDLFDEFKVGVTFPDPAPEALAGAVRTLCNATDPQSLIGHIRAAKDRYSWHAAATATLTGYGMAQQPTLEANDRTIATTPAQ